MATRPRVDYPVPNPLSLTHSNLPGAPCYPRASVTPTPRALATVYPPPSPSLALKSLTHPSVTSSAEGMELVIIVPRQQDCISPGSAGSNAVLQNHGPHQKLHGPVWLVGLCLGRAGCGDPWIPPCRGLPTPSILISRRWGKG